MVEALERIRKNIRDLQEQLEEEYRKRREAVEYSLRGKKVIFQSETLRSHLARRETILGYLRHARLFEVLTAPLIYSLVIPFALIHLWVWIYQTVCFPLYRIPKVPQSEYIRIDRHHLRYLNVIEKLNCVYCGYCNGVVAWVREVAARTEAHWCPIKHASRVEGTHDLYSRFVDYGDPDAYLERLSERRDRQRK